MAEWLNVVSQTTAWVLNPGFTSLMTLGTLPTFPFCMMGTAIALVAGLWGGVEDSPSEVLREGPAHSRFSVDGCCCQTLNSHPTGRRSRLHRRAGCWGPEDPYCPAPSFQIKTETQGGTGQDFHQQQCRVTCLLLNLAPRFFIFLPFVYNQKESNH